MSDDKTRILNAEDLAALAAPTGSEDTRTRVLSAAEAARLSGRPKAETPPKAPAQTEDRKPKLVGSKIVFYCSNGHKITVDRSMAGKHGQCQGLDEQGCGVAFVVPNPAGVLQQPDRPALPVEPVVAVDQTPAAAEAAADAAEPAAGALAFDVGPPSEPSADASPEPAPAADWAFGAEAPPSGGQPSVNQEIDSAAGAAGWSIDIDEIENPTARLVARLWLERAHGGVVEVHLSGGSVIMPEWYEPRWSGGTHALFAAQAADGTITLTAVAWDQVQKVVVRQVQGTPDGMFEG